MSNILCHSVIHRFNKSSFLVDTLLVLVGPASQPLKMCASAERYHFRRGFVWMVEEQTPICGRIIAFHRRYTWSFADYFRPHKCTSRPQSSSSIKSIASRSGHLTDEYISYSVYSPIAGSGICIGDTWDDERLLELHRDMDNFLVHDGRHRFPHFCNRGRARERES